jgi:hypothetical protein
MEAVRMAANARHSAVETLTTDPATKLPPRLQAALGVVIGAAVQALLEAVDGSGVGTDAVQWGKRWSDEAARIANGTPYNEDYFIHRARTLATVEDFLSAIHTLPENYKLHCICAYTMTMCIHLRKSSTLCTNHTIAECKQHRRPAAFVVGVFARKCD